MGFLAPTRCSAEFSGKYGVSQFVAVSCRALS